MPLANGTKLGPYAILAPIGAGGMGEVYKAKDTRLDRTVAIKVLPSELAASDDLRARFEREARAVSALNHPHICTLYDIGRDNGVDFLVMEYIPGETIADRLRRGPLPLEEALRYGTQIADALDKAHRTGIAHRDLKPGNVILSESGAKLLDFGLATRVPAPESPISSFPTRAGPLTPKGAVLGTLQYMAPEQLEGKEADARTDIFAFGAVLYEMVTGHKALRNALPETEALSSIPPPLDHVIRRCLARDPQKRWQAASDVMMELEFVAGGGGAPVVAPRHPRREAVAWSIAALAVAASVTILLLTENPTPSRVRRATLQLSQGEGLVTGPGYFGALSPDGTHLAYRAVRNGIAQLWLRRLDRFESTPIAGSEGAGTPCFSPDGAWIGFDAGGEVKKVSVAGGAPVPLGRGPTGMAPVWAGATWTRQDTIVFGDRNSGLWRISAFGGEAQPLTKPDPKDVGTGHVWPEVLPTGKGVLFTVAKGERASNRLAVLSLETGAWRILGNGTQPRMSPSGHIVFARNESLWAADFDAERLEMVGPATQVLEGVRVNSGHGAVQYTMALDGTLVYLPSGTGEENDLVTVDRTGAISPLLGGGLYGQPRLSPDGSRIAFTNWTPSGNHIWIFDSARSTRMRLTVEGELNFAPTWTPDGARIAFTSVSAGGGSKLYWQSADGSGQRELLSTTGGTPGSFSPDGRQLMYEVEAEGGSDIAVLPLEGDGTPATVLGSTFNETEPSFAPDGRLLAYVSDESGRNEVYVRPYPGPGAKWAISNGGGTQPVWSADGRELFYRSGDRMMVVRVQVAPTFRASTTDVLFEGVFLGDGEGFERSYDVSRDAKRFVLARPGSSPKQLNIVLNFPAELTALVPRR